MNLPIRALYEISAFSKPMTRPDWKTCKLSEAACISISTKETILHMTNSVHDERGNRICTELLTWTHYGRLLIIAETRKHYRWSLFLHPPSSPPVVDDPSWYFKRFKWVAR
jgi:hypothetical protein